MLLVFFVALRCVYAGSPHAVYGVPPVGSNFGSSQPQSNPPLTGHSSGTQWVVNPYSQQSTQAWKNGYQSQPGRTKPAPSYWGGTYDNYRPSALAASQKGVKLISAASATYRPYSGSPPDQRIAQEFYNSLHSFPPANNQYPNQRNDPNGYYNRPGDSSDSRYNDFLRRYYDWYYQNAYREASPAAGYYPPGSLQPPGDPGYRELLGAYSPPSPATAGGGVPWWLHGGFSRPAPVANPAPVTSSAPFPSSSSGGPVGPFTAPPVELSSIRPIPKKTSVSSSIKLPGKASGASLITDRINEGPTSESHESSKTDFDSTSEEKPYSEAEATSEATTASRGSSEPESKDTNSPADSVTTPETASSEGESSSPSSEESSSPSSAESPSPSSEESASPSTEENSSPSSEESLSTSLEESSSPSSEESSSPSSEEISSPSSEESSSPSSEESSSSSSEEISSPSTEESSSPPSEESLSPSTEESSSPSTEENSSPSSEDSSTTDNVTTSSDSSEMNTIKKDD